MATSQHRSPIDPRMIKLGNVFTPATPIHHADLFAGRSSLMLRIADAVNQPGMHCILFGERGVGKTSLANILPGVIGSSIGHGEMATASINCDTSDTYATLVRKLMQEILTVQELPRLGFRNLSDYFETPIADRLPEQPTPNDLRLLMQSIPANWLLIVDEFDRLVDEESIRLTTDTIKILSDYSVPATIVLVGVADSVDALLREHQSVERCLTQVHMPRMNLEELRTIIDNGLRQVDMDIEPAVAWQVPTVSQGYPHYTHLLILHAARSAVANGRSTVNGDDINTAISESITLSEHSIRTGYSTAVYSANKSALFEPVLLACALAPTDDLNYFNARSVTAPLSHIMGRKMDVPAFAKHLDRFCQSTRGPVLHRSGQSRRYRYRFAIPLMRPFVLLQGIADGRITIDDIGMFSTTQHSLQELRHD